MTPSDRLPGHRECAGDCTDDAAPYVLGALDGGEARTFARHLAGCAVCRGEVAALTPVVDALSLGVRRYKLPRALRRRVTRSVRAEPRQPVAPAPRKRAWRLLPAIALWRGAVIGGLAGGLAIVVVCARLHWTGATERVIPASVGRAALRVHGGYGELVIDHLPPAPRGRVYELWVQHSSRPPARATLFGVTSRGTADIGVPGALNDVRRVMVTLEPAGGTEMPTARPVIVARAS